MMPQVVTVQVHSGPSRRLRLWVPLLPVWLLLSPFVLLVLPVFLIACRASGGRPFAALAGLWRLLCSLTGASVDLERGRRRLAIRIA